MIDRRGAWSDLARLKSAISLDLYTRARDAQRGLEVDDPLCKLMEQDPEKRFRFIMHRTKGAESLDI